MESIMTEPVKGSRIKFSQLPATLIIGGIIVGLLLCVALLSFVWIPYDPIALNVRDRYLPIGSEGYLLGTDKFGRDVLTQIMMGARNSLFVSVVSTLVSLMIGTLLGLYVAAAGKRTQNIISRAVDVGVAIPGILIALVLATAIGPGNMAAITAIIIWFIPVSARVVIGPAVQVLSQDYIEAAFGYGRKKWFVLFNHVLPNISSTIIVQASVMFAAAILIEAALSFLGVGAQSPIASWGRTLKEAQPLMEIAPSLMVVPGLAIVLAVLGFNLLGDGLRAYLDPQQTRKR
jgi:peptide/nickel transport system permease protein